MRVGDKICHGRATNGKEANVKRDLGMIGAAKEKANGTFKMVEFSKVMGAERFKETTRTAKMMETGGDPPLEVTFSFQQGVRDWVDRVRNFLTEFRNNTGT